MKFPKEFLLGASTAAHQVEGNNRYSDLWAQEQMEHSSFAEPSNDAVDHYHRYEEDIALLAGAGLNAYRFSIEWARVEPQEGCFDESELEHYRKVIRCCREHGVEPVVTLHHFSSPKWLIERGGWEAESDASRAVRLTPAELEDVLRPAMEYAAANGMEINFTSPGWLPEETLRTLGFTQIPSCGACLSNMAVAPDGTVLPCQSWLTGKGLGNMLRTPWPRIWHSGACRAIRGESAKMERRCQLGATPMQEGC